MVAAGHSNIRRGTTPRFPYLHPMASPTVHYSSYQEPVSYASIGRYDELIYSGERDGDVYPSQLWQQDPRKLQVANQHQQHLLPSPQPPVHSSNLTIQTHFSEHKSLPYYSHQPSPPSTASSATSSYSDGVYNQQVPSEEWVHPHARSAYPVRPFIQPEMHVKHEDQGHTLESYPSPQPAIHFEGVQGGYYSAYSVPHPELSSPDTSSVGSPHLPGSYAPSPQLACDPRYVSQEPSVEQARDGLVNKDGDDVDGFLTSSLSPTLGSSPSSSDLDDDDYDPRDPDYTYRSRARRSSVPNSHIADEHRTLRSRSATLRYSPYSTSTSSFETDYPQTRPRRTSSNVSDTSSLSSSSNLPLTPSSSVDSKSRTGSAGLPLPVPVPNLTKKSRGRRVPTVQNLDPGKGPVDASCGLDNGEFGELGNPISTIGSTAGLTGGRRGASKGVRMFTCKVDGCGKCFARGEHLKRHVRSIHTYEKPHKCPHPGCGKDFSRHDNLNQHMRVHLKDKSR